MPSPLVVTLPDGKTVDGETWRTTPYDIALGISKGLADACVVSKVDGEVGPLSLLIAFIFCYWVTCSPN